MPRILALNNLIDAGTKLFPHQQANLLVSNLCMLNLSEMVLLTENSES